MLPAGGFDPDQTPNEHAGNTFSPLVEPLMADPILLARHGDTECHLLPALANRHGLITGATGTGKTISLQSLAESLSKIGVPVFLADIKGDLTGISQTGAVSPKLAGILAERGLDTRAGEARMERFFDSGDFG